MQNRDKKIKKFHEVLLDKCPLFSGGSHLFVATVNLINNTVRYEVFNCLEKQHHSFDDFEKALEYWNTLFS